MVSRARVNVWRPSEMRETVSLPASDRRMVGREDAKASVVFEMVPMPVGIEQAKQEEDNEETFGRFTGAGADRGFQHDRIGRGREVHRQYYVVGVYENNRTLQDTDSTYSRAYYLDAGQGCRRSSRSPRGSPSPPALTPSKGSGAAPTAAAATTEDKSNSGRVNVTGTTANAALQENLEMEYGLCDLQDDGRRVRGRLSGRRRVGHPVRRYPGLPPAGAVDQGLRPHDPIWASMKRSTRRTRSLGTSTASTLADGDNDNYAVAGIYNWKAGRPVSSFKYIDGRQNRPTANFRTQIYTALPYMKATFGPVYIEAEGQYLGGKTAKYESPSTAPDIDKEGYGAWIMAKYTHGSGLLRRPVRLQLG